MNQHTIVHAVLAFSLAVSLILQPANPTSVSADVAVRRVVPGGSMDPACGGGWNLASPNPALRPCDLQTALDASAMLDEIWAAEGVYIPSKLTDPADPRTATFKLPVGGPNYDGVALYGGFAGTETSLQQRDWKRHITVLSGDLDRNDLHRPAAAATDIQGANAYHVVNISPVSDTAVLDGFTISGGAADDGLSVFPDRGQGGGIYNNGGHPMLRNLVIQGNTAVMGGGVFNLEGHPTMTNILFRGNTANLGGGMNNAGAAPALTNVTFYSNSASYSGGALFNAGVDMESDPLYPLLTNVTLFSNSAKESGGAIENRTSHLVFANSILWGNRPDQIYNNVNINPNVRLTLRDSLVEDGCPDSTTCTNVLTDYPYLGPLTGAGNFQLLPLKPASPAIDKVPAERCTRINLRTMETEPLTFDQRGAARPYGEACDMGAFEYSPRTLFVDDSAAGTNSGASWADAFTSLQSALDSAVIGDKIWVAAGTYYPTNDPSDRSASFNLREAVEIYGGFAGTESALAQRDVMENETILSGDIDHALPAPTGNSYHVVYSDLSLNAGSVLDGFTITDGSATGPLAQDGSAVNRQGGGVYIKYHQAMLRNLVIRNNTAEQGGGMFNDAYSHLDNVLFRDNTAVYGGGLANGERPVQDDQHDQFMAILTNVTFTRNTADFGGAIANRGTTPLYIPPYVTQPDMVHMTITGNTARQQGGAIYAAGSRQMISNSILWGNGSNPLYAADAESAFSLRNSILQGGCPAGAACTEVSGADPLLGVLGSAAGGPPTFPPGPNSPAIDAGAAADCTRLYFTGTFTYERPPLTFDQRGAPRPVGAACDLGAHEYQAALAVVSGDNQRTDANTPFPGPLVVAASSAWGDPVEGLIVHFTPMLSDAGGRISSSTAAVSGGQASVTAAAQAAPGFSVNAAAPGINTVTFHLSVNDTKVTLTASPNPAAFGQTVTLTARVDGTRFGFPPTPTGSVTFKDGSTPLGTVTLPAAGPIGDPFAQAVLTVSNLSSGAHALTAVYSGDAFYHDVTTSAALNVTISGTGAPVGLGGLAQTYTGAPRTVSVSTTPANLAVRVTYNGSTEPPVKAGSYAVYAEITDPNYTGSATGTLVISKAWLKVRADIQSRPYGAPNPPLTYTISGYVNGEGPSAIQGSPVLTCDANFTSRVGSYTIEIGPGTLTSENYQFSVEMTKLYVTKATTTTQLTANPAAPNFSQPVTFTASVAGQYPAGGPPTGSLTFSVDGAVVGSPVLLVDGKASFSTSSLTLGQHTILAQYAGSSNHESSSGIIEVEIKPGAAAINLSNLTYTYDGKPHGAAVATTPTGLAYSITYNNSASQPVKAGSYAVRVTITDPNYAGSSTGTLEIQKAGLTVTAEDKSKVYGTANPTLTYKIAGYVNGETSTVLSGLAAVSTTAVTLSPFGTYPITASLGTLTAENYGFTFAAGTLSILKNQTSTTVTTSPNPSSFGQAVTFTAVVTGQPGTPNPSGSVTFTVGGIPSSPVALVNGQASKAVTPTSTGTIPYQVQYNPDGNHGPSSAPGSLTVRAANASITLSGLSTVYNGQPHPVTITTDPPGLSVLVAYNGQAAPPVNAGSYLVQAAVDDSQYSGTASASLVIAKAQAAVTLTGLNVVYNGLPQPVTVTTDPPGLAVTVTYISQPAGTQAGSLPSAVTRAGSAKLARLLPGSVLSSGSQTAPAAAGTYAVSVEVTNDNYQGEASETLWIDKAPLSVSVEPAARPFGAPDPVIRSHFEGFVNGEDESVISGAPALGPLPALAAPPGQYPIDVRMGSLEAFNYAFELIPGELIITKAGTHIRLAAAPTPVRAGEPVTLTAVVSPETGQLPDGVHFGGSAVFSITGSPPVAVPLDSNGTAVYQLDTPPPGAYDVAVQYQGDTNFSGSSAGPLQFFIEWLRLFLPLVMQ